MPMPNCDVCGGPAVGVASCTFAAISFAYCEPCVQSGAEPFSMLAGWLGVCGVADATSEFAEDYKPTIAATCERVGKTEAEFWAEAKRVWEAFLMDGEAGRV